MSENTVDTLNGLFKKQYHSDLENLLPDHAILQKDGDNGLIKWVPSDKMNGEFYSVPVLLRSNQGVTYLGESGAVGDLKSAKAAVMKEAQVRGSEMNVRGHIGYKALSQAAEKGARAFKKASAWLVEDLAQVMHTRVEIAALHGQSGLGVVASASNVSGNIYNVVITEATFAPGMWILLEGATVQLFDVAGTAERAAGVVGTISTVTTSSRTVKISFDGAITPTAGDTIFFEGAATDAGSSITYSEMVGLKKQISDASSTSLFNLDRSAYSLIQGNTKTLSSVALTKARLIDAAMLAVDKGAVGKLIALVSTKTWANLNAEDMALRRFDGSYSTEKSKSGAKKLVYTTMAGEIEVVCHPFMKYGECYVLSPDDIFWVGSAKPTFEVPGFSETFFRLVQDKNAVELQNYADLAIFCLKPSHCVLIDGIVNS